MYVLPFYYMHIPSLMTHAMQAQRSSNRILVTWLALGIQSVPGGCEDNYLLVACGIV